MKRLFVFIPVIVLALFLLNSFVLKEGDADKVTSNKSGLVNTVFKSTDGGETWQDISKGLPKNLRADTVRVNSFFANDKGLFLKVGNGLDHSAPNATAPFWTKELLSIEHSSIAPDKSKTVAYNSWGVNLKTKDGTSVWSPVFDSSSEPRMRSVFETAGGAIFIGTDKGLFKTANNGKTWKHVYDGGWAGNFAESDGLLLSTSKRRIIRSADNGETWALVNEGGTTWDVKQINRGFAALSSNSSSDARRLCTSYDGGKTWQPLDADQDKVFIDSLWRTWNTRPRTQAVQTSITQFGENFFSSHPDGIFKSSDNGKTWKLLFPSVEGKVSSLFISGNVLYIVYAIPSKDGC